MFSALLAHLVLAGEPSPSLERAKTFYEEVQYEKCVDMTDRAVDETDDPAERVEIDLYAGLCQFNLGANDEATEHFRRALKRDRQAKLPPYSPPKAVTFFQGIANRMSPPSEPEAPLKPPPSKAPVVKAPPEPPDTPRRPTLTPSPKNRDVEEALAPTQRRPFPTATVTLGATAVVAAGLGTGLYVYAQSLATQANDALFAQPATELGDRARTVQAASFASFGAAGAAAVSALIVYLTLEKLAPATNPDMR